MCPPPFWTTSRSRLLRDMFRGGNFLFTQDNAPSHASHSSQDFLRQHGVRFLSKDE